MKVPVKNVRVEFDRYGNERIYYRVRHGKRTRLRGPVGSPEFWSDYNQAASMTEQPGTKGDTLRVLCVRYYGSAAYKQLKASTRNVRRNMLDRFCEAHGHKRYAQLEPRHCRTIRDTYTETPDAWNNLRKAMIQVFKYAVEYDLVASNPFAQVTKLKSRPGGIHAWTLDEIARFEARHPIGTKARLAMALLLYTGQRRGDVVGMGRQHIRDGWLRVTQQKTGKALELPVLGTLADIIAASPTGDLTLLVTDYGKPFTAAGFGNWFRDRCNEAGLPQCSAHGLRKAAANALAEAGATSQEIMAITGHESLAEVERYTKSADQKRRAESAMRRVEHEHSSPHSCRVRPSPQI